MIGALCLGDVASAVPFWNLLEQIEEGSRRSILDHRMVSHIPFRITIPIKNSECTFILCLIMAGTYGVLPTCVARIWIDPDDDVVISVSSPHLTHPHLDHVSVPGPNLWRDVGVQWGVRVFALVSLYEARVASVGEVLLDVFASDEETGTPCIGIHDVLALDLGSIFRSVHQPQSMAQLV